MSVVKMRLERLWDERTRAEQTIEELRAHAENDGARDLTDAEVELIDRHRTRIGELDGEIGVLADDLERVENARDVSKLIRGARDPEPASTIELGNGNGQAPVVYRHYAAYARDAIITRFPTIAAKVSGVENETREREAALDRLNRAVQNTLTSDIAGLVPPAYMAQIMDIIGSNRPVVSSARQSTLTSGQMTYPRITQRPEVLKQGSEKTEAGTRKMSVVLDTMTADTYLGAGDLSWQAINWSSPDALQLWFDLAAEAYARATETAACNVLGSAAMGTVTPPLGTTGTETLAQWRAAVIGAVGSIYGTTGGRARTNTLYLAPNRFFALAQLGDLSVATITPVGNLNIDAMSGTFNGLRVVASYGFPTNTGIVGDSTAFLVAETAGAPVELRAVEPSIGGMEVGVIGAFAAKVFDTSRFLRIS